MPDGLSKSTLNRGFMILKDIHHLPSLKYARPLSFCFLRDTKEKKLPQNYMDII